MIKEFGKLGFHFIINNSNFDFIYYNIFKELKPVSVTRNFIEEININKIDLNEDDLISITFSHQKYLIIMTINKIFAYIEVYIGFYPECNDQLDIVIKNKLNELGKISMYCICGFELEIEEKYAHNEEEVVRFLISHKNFLPVYLKTQDNIKIFGKDINIKQQNFLQNYIEMYW